MANKDIIRRVQRDISARHRQSLTHIQLSATRRGRKRTRIDCTIQTQAVGIDNADIAAGQNDVACTADIRKVIGILSQRNVAGTGIDCRISRNIDRRRSGLRDVAISSRRDVQIRCSHIAKFNVVRIVQRYVRTSCIHRRTEFMICIKNHIVAARRETRGTRHRDHTRRVDDVTPGSDFE